MRQTLTGLMSAALAITAAAGVAAANQRDTAAAEPAAARGADQPRRCLPAHAVVPPFNNSPEALDQARVAATMIAGEVICQTSAVAPEFSRLKHGEEQPVLPDDVAVPEGTQVAQAPVADTPDP